MSGPTFCGKCKAAIKGRTLNALGKSWHPEHFVCQVCQKPITNSTFNEREGQPVCPPCFAQKFCEKCYHCKKPIIGKVIKAMNHSYHEDHFMCAGPCQKPMAMSTPFFQKEGKPYCKTDYDIMFRNKEAAVKIQAVFRGHKVRATMKQGDSSSNNSKEVAKVPSTNNADTTDEPTKEELEAEFREDDKELCHAATRIQATFRGHLARKANEGQALKDEKDLQEITQKVAEELDIDLSDPELNKAATKIQASFRGHKARQTEGSD